MAQRARHDDPGSWHHVMNRGIARRTVFETRGDVRSMLAALAWEVRRQEIEVHSYAFLTTHFHMLIHSPRGHLGDAMRRALNLFVRRFNRLRRRDGSLFRGRFRSRPVRTLVYRRCVVRYSDHNPVSAGLVARAGEYPYSSAEAHATGERPPWLAGWWIDAELGRGRDGVVRPYEGLFGRPSPSVIRLVAHRMRLPAHATDPLDDLVAAAGPRVLEWMARKAELADETKPGIAVCDAETILARTAPGVLLDGNLEVAGPSGRARPLSDLLRVALLRDLGGLPYAMIAGRTNRSASWCRRVYQRHAALMATEPVYAAAVAEHARAALEACYGG